jgi:hypothetical protein
MNIDALACAGLDRLADGYWSLHSRFTQAVNFSHRNGQLLTFWRYGKGMGPGGLLLSTRDFSLISTLQHVEKQGLRLQGEGMVLRARRVLALTAGRGKLCRPALSSLQAPTGLCGSLHELNSEQEDYRLLRDGLQIWHRGGVPEWSMLIGKGPGLTPGGDDMLTGAMAVLWTTPWAARLQGTAFLPPAGQLAFLTTSVSCSYLNSAREGMFSTPVLRVLRHLQSGRNSLPAIRRLLSIGHTSGADILTGMVVALDWLQTLQCGRDHAGSGNYSNVYSGCGDGELLPCRQRVT